MGCVVFPGAFDPMTLGHLDLVVRASQLFERVIVAVATQSGSKSHHFSLEQRISFIQASLDKPSNVEVLPLSGLLTDFLKNVQAQAVLRGIRSERDVGYEWSMATANYQLAPQFETIWLPARNQYAHVSSSLIWDIAKHGGDIKHWVPPVVAKAMTTLAID